LPKEVLSSKKLDAKVWLGEVSKIIEGKVGRVLADQSKYAMADNVIGWR
jgi:hypothetical protein